LHKLQNLSITVSTLTGTVCSLRLLRSYVAWRWRSSTNRRRATTQSCRCHGNNTRQR